jgi:type III secretory pathway component EscS
MNEKEISNFLLMLVIIFEISGVTSIIMIAVALEKRKVKVNFLFLRLLILKYIRDYKKITLKETGKVGHLYYSFIISMNAALVAAIVGILIRVL